MRIRQSKLLIVGGLAALLVWSSNASAGGDNFPASFKSEHAGKSAGSLETVCENLKLDAAARYFQCLTGAYRVANTRGGEPSDSSIAQCDARFDRAVERAETIGGCHTPGNPSVLGDPIKALAKASALGITAEMGGCTHLSIYSKVAICALGPGGRAVNLPAVIDAINAAGGNVDENTTLYIEAWGGDGGTGNTNNGSRGGYGGYAQTTTTTSAISAAYGTTELYYFIGHNGSGAANAGGDGGTATMVTTNDLSTEQATIADTLLIAGGGAGGGAGRGKQNVCSNPLLPVNDMVLGALGGNGGAAIASLGNKELAAGAKGGERAGYNYSGFGAPGDAAGDGGGVNGADHVLDRPATPGEKGMAPIGGVGGNHNDPQTGFANSTTVVSKHGGGGGWGQEDAGGGGGGGGWGGGGGGAGNVDPDNSNDNTNCITGGGGGGASLAVASTATCSAAPTSAPANPSGSQGFARIVFDLGGCQ